MAAWIAAARQATHMARFSSQKSAPLHGPIIQRRCLSGGGGHHGPPRVNCWEDPLSPSKWKEEHKVEDPPSLDAQH